MFCADWKSRARLTPEGELRWPRWTK